MSETAARAGPPKARKVPRPFTMPWGKGSVVEEASIATDYNEFVVQLLRYEAMREAVKATPTYRRLLAALVDDSPKAAP